MVEAAPGTEDTGNGNSTAPANASWFSTLDADAQSHITNRGWDKLDVNAAAAAAIKAHREAEKLLGVPQDQLLRFPKDINDKDSYARIYERLGVPKDMKDYAFDGVKFKDGTELDASFVDSVRSIATKYHMNKDDAKGLAADLVGIIEAGEASDAADYEGKLAAEKDALSKNWGNNFNANMIVAKNAAAKLGLTAEEVSALEKTTSYSRVMEMFRNIGSRLGEDKFIRENGGGNNPMTKEQAQHTLDMRKNDSIWLKKFSEGDSEARREFDNLTALIAGTQG